ncbi:MAG: restriction endonuclease subunit S [Ignavibacterium sp.]|jgi:type I restriction enzyme S subunit|nr:restriction endonuclease subunit S [Ignavibacterium sp.]
MSKNNEIKLVPILRFSEFKNGGVWKVKPLGEVLIKNSTKNKDQKYSLVESVSNKFGFIKQDEYFDNRIIASKDTSNYYVINRGYFAYNPSRIDIGSLAYKSDDNTSIISPLYVSFKANNSVIDDIFLLNYFKSNEFSKQMIFEGGVRNTLNYDNLSQIKVPITQLDEQRKIAACLSSLDEVITAESQKLEVLKEHKKGLLQNLFSKEGETVPKLRFKEFENSGEWVEKKLGEISENVMYGMNSASKDFDGENKYLRITDIDENTRLFLQDSVTSPDGILEEKYLLKIGDVVFARTGASVGKSYLHQKGNDKVYFAGFLIRFSIKNEIPYFIYAQTLTEKYKKWVSKTSLRSGQPGINAEEYKSYSFFVPPSLQEQQKIASCLSSLDDLIRLQAERIEQLQLHKKGLLQGLFPNLNEVTE